MIFLIQYFYVAKYNSHLRWMMFFLFVLRTSAITVGGNIISTQLFGKVTIEGDDLDWISCLDGIVTSIDLGSA